MKVCKLSGLILRNPSTPFGGKRLLIKRKTFCQWFHLFWGYITLKYLFTFTRLQLLRGKRNLYSIYWPSFVVPQTNSVLNLNHCWSELLYWLWIVSDVSRTIWWFLAHFLGGIKKLYPLKTITIRIFNRLKLFTAPQKFFNSEFDQSNKYLLSLPEVFLKSNYSSELLLWLPGLFTTLPLFF